MSKVSKRHRAIEAAKLLAEVHRDQRIELTEEERDWCLILSERLYGVYNKRPRIPAPAPEPESSAITFLGPVLPPPFDWRMRAVRWPPLETPPG